MNPGPLPLVLNLSSLQPPKHIFIEYIVLKLIAPNARHAIILNCRKRNKRFYILMVIIIHIHPDSKMDKTHKNLSIIADKIGVLQN